MRMLQQIPPFPHCNSIEEFIRIRIVLSARSSVHWQSSCTVCMPVHVCAVKRQSMCWLCDVELLQLVQWGDVVVRQIVVRGVAHGRWILSTWANAACGCAGYHCAGRCGAWWNARVVAATVWVDASAVARRCVISCGRYRRLHVLPIGEGRRRLLVAVVVLLHSAWIRCVLLSWRHGTRLRGEGRSNVLGIRTCYTIEQDWVQLICGAAIADIDGFVVMRRELHQCVQRGIRNQIQTCSKSRQSEHAAVENWGGLLWECACTGFMLFQQELQVGWGVLVVRLQLQFTQKQNQTSYAYVLVCRSVVFIACKSVVFISY